jgi:glycosyltransferase involved in cell wall biosynthesis
MGTLFRIPVLVASCRDLKLRKGWLVTLFDRMMMKWADATTCCSEAVRQFALAHGRVSEDRIVTIHNGIDLVRFSRPSVLQRSNVQLRDGVPVIGTVCRLVEPKKGLSVLLQAMKQLLVSAPTRAWQLIIVGEGPALPQLKQRCKELEIWPHVIFAGVYPRAEEVLPLMDIFVMPSLYEGFGISLIEAMAARRPVVATKVGGIPEIVTHNESGLLVPPGDPLSLAAAIDRLLGDPVFADKLAAAGHAKVHERFSIDVAVTRHETLYETLLAQGTTSVNKHEFLTNGAGTAHQMK